MANCLHTQSDSFPFTNFPSMPIETSFQNENVLSNDKKISSSTSRIFQPDAWSSFFIGKEGHQWLIVQASVKVMRNKVLAIKIKEIIPPAYRTPTLTSFRKENLKYRIQSSILHVMKLVFGIGCKIKLSADTLWAVLALNKFKKLKITLSK